MLSTQNDRSQVSTSNSQPALQRPRAFRFPHAHSMFSAPAGSAAAEDGSAEPETLAEAYPEWSAPSFQQDLSSDLRSPVVKQLLLVDHETPSSPFQSHATGMTGVDPLNRPLTQRGDAAPSFAYQRTVDLVHPAYWTLMPQECFLTETEKSVFGFLEKWAKIKLWERLKRCEERHEGAKRDLMRVSRGDYLIGSDDEEENEGEEQEGEEQDRQGLIQRVRNWFRRRKKSSNSNDDESNADEFGRMITPPSFPLESEPDPERLIEVKAIRGVNYRFKEGTIRLNLAHSHDPYDSVSITPNLEIRWGIELTSSTSTSTSTNHTTTSLTSALIGKDKLTFYSTSRILIRIKTGQLVLIPKDRTEPILLILLTRSRDALEWSRFLTPTRNMLLSLASDSRAKQSAAMCSLYSLKQKINLGEELTFEENQIFEKLTRISEECIWSQADVFSIESDEEEACWRGRRRRPRFPRLPSSLPSLLIRLRSDLESYAEESVPRAKKGGFFDSLIDSDTSSLASTILSSSSSSSGARNRNIVPEIPVFAADRPWYDRVSSSWGPEDVLEWIKHEYVQERRPPAPEPAAQSQSEGGGGEAFSRGVGIGVAEEEIEMEEEGEGVVVRDQVGEEEEVGMGGPVLVDPFRVITIEQLLKEKNLYPTFVHFVRHSVNPYQDLKSMIDAKVDERRALQGVEKDTDISWTLNVFDEDEDFVDDSSLMDNEGNDQFSTFSVMASPLWRRLRDGFLIRSFTDAIGLIQQEGGWFKMARFLVQKKFVHHVTRVKKEHCDLTRLNEGLLGDKRTLWDVDLLTNEFLFMLLYNRTIQSFVNELKSGLTGNQDHRLVSDLMTVADKFHIPLSSLDFNLYRQHQLASLGQKISALTPRLEVLDREIMELKVEISGRTDDVRNMVTVKGTEYRNLEGDLLFAQIEGIIPEMQLETLYVLPMKQLQEEIDQLKIALEGGDDAILRQMQASLVAKQEEKGQLEAEKVALDEKYVLFSAHSREQRKQLEAQFERECDWGAVVERLISMQLSRLVQSQSVYQLSLKLVLSQLKSNIPSGVTRFGARVYDTLFHPSSMKWGLLHASLIVKNVQCHWFSNAFVTVKDYKVPDHYTDVFAVDLSCPLLCKKRTLSNAIYGIAKTLIEWNTTYGYEPLARSSRRGAATSVNKNCQLFCQELMFDKLQTPPLLPSVDSFMEVLKEHVSDYPEASEDWMRFEYDSFFFALFYPAFEAIFPLARPSSGSIVFRSHAEVDDFYHGLLLIEPGFPYLFPDVSAVLKGFDRAFELRLQKVPEDEECPVEFRPSTRNRCPFNQMYSM